MLGLIADPSPLQSDVDCTGTQIDPQVRRLIIFNQRRASLFGNNDFRLFDYAPCFVFSFAAQKLRFEGLG
jgi:hypothetical protein